ncbi:MAG: hypothetical protein ABI303_01835 [Candidatus Saccharimonas sp.]
MDRGARLRGLFTYLKKNWFLFFAVAIYIFFSAYYMGPGFTNCADSIYGFGDSTAGPIWRNSLKPEQPLFGGYETSTNYPYGESLYSPVGFAASVQTVSMNIGSKVVGPMCAYNLYNIAGYIITAMVMFLFILYLTKNRWIALIAGYAVSFTPYVQSKVGGHPNYGYAGLLIGLLWLTVYTLESRKKKGAIALGSLLALSAYLDPYFTLLSATVVVPTAFAWLCIKAVRAKKESRSLRDELKRVAKPVVVSIIAFIIVLAPIGAMRVLDAGSINQTVSASRGNVFAAAMQCSNMPIDYLLPDPMNVHLVDTIGPSYSAHNIALRHWCGSGESRVSLSLTLIAVIVVAGGLALYRTARRRKKERLSLSYDTHIVVLSAIFVGLAGLMVGLPPKVHGLIMPSGVILKITEMWRIFAREYLVVNLALVVVAAIALYYLVRHVKWLRSKVAVALLLAAVFGGVLFEYQINAPFSPMTFSYARDVPHVYETIKDNPDIQAIAEYPMDRLGVEHDSVVYYMTMQAVHGKKMVNSVLSTDSRMTTHIALKDLSAPQTIPALRYLGVHYVVVHGESVSDIVAKTNGNLEPIESDVSKVFGLSIVRSGENNRVTLFKIKDGPLLSSVLTIEKGFVVNLPLLQSPIATEYEILNNAELKRTPLKDVDNSKAAVCFDVKMSAIGDVGELTVYEGDSIVSKSTISDAYSQVVVPNMADNDTLRITNNKGYNMRLKNLSVGCSLDRVIQ